MILVDTSVWIDHLRHGESILIRLLEAGDVLVHPWVTEELALGNMRNRGETLRLLAAMPQAPVANHDAFLEFIHAERLFGLGIGVVDAHLLVSTRAATGTLLWTRDRRLGDVASRLSLRFEEPQPIDNE